MLSASPVLHQAPPIIAVTTQINAYNKVAVAVTDFSINSA